MKRLPKAELQVMKAIWAYEPPVTSSMVMGAFVGRKKLAYTIGCHINREFY
jgi:predicted transcriptional regulator